MRAHCEEISAAPCSQFCTSATLKAMGRDEKYCSRINSFFSRCGSFCNKEEEGRQKKEEEERRRRKKSKKESV
jgi:hypothetical protein